MDLKKMREAKQLTQTQVAEAVGIARESYTNIENGVRRPSVKVAMRLGDVLDFKWALLFEDDEQSRCCP